MMSTIDAPIALQPYRNVEKAFVSVSPEGWLSVAPGLHMQKPNGTAILQTAFSTTDIRSLLSSLMAHTGIKEMPIAVDIREANGLLWKLYQATNDRSYVDIGLAQADGLTFVVLLHGPQSTDHTPNTNLFLSIIDRFTPEVAPV